MNRRLLNCRVKKELDDLSKHPEKQPNQKEIRERKRQELKARIQKINQMIEETKNDSAMSDHERQTQLNQLERKKFDLNDQLLDLI